ncbi:ATP-binding protein [Thermodesulfobacteriota bacterium]
MTNQTDLYQELAAKHGFPNSKYLPLIFKRLATEDQVKILLQFPGTSETIAEKLSMDQAELEKNVQELFEKGMAFPSSKGWRGGRMMDSVHDLTLSNKKYWESYGGTEFGLLWRAFERIEWFPEVIGHLLAMEVPVLRVVPAWETVKDNPELLPEEDMREIYAKTDSIVLIPCPCRVENYDRECDSPDEMCISLNRSAEYNLRRGVGRKLTVEEAIEFEETVRKHDGVTVVPNSPQVDMVVCHCHGCCCLGFHMLRTQDVPLTTFAEKSRYEAKVDPVKCIACQKCVETCQFDAVELKKYPDMAKWKAFINPDKCMGCGNCVLKCKKNALEMQVVRPPEHIPQGEMDLYAYGAAKKK